MIVTVISAKLPFAQCAANSTKEPRVPDAASCTKVGFGLPLTFITQSLEAGVPIRDVQATVNHASVTTTETYAHTAKRHRNSTSLRVSY